MKKSLSEQESIKIYSEGYELGKSIMRGAVGATRSCGINGQFYLDEATSVAEKLNLSFSELLQIIKNFHAERLDSEPDLNLYPELKGARDSLLDFYRGMRNAGMSDELIFIRESLAFWQKFRLRQQFKDVHKPQIMESKQEKCRIVYLPETDRGAIHFKNIDDPIATWIPHPPENKNLKWEYSPLFFDGVGSGLHIDESPKEIFPVDPLKLAKKYCRTVSEVEEFLTRYNYFWDGSNLLVHDDTGNSIAFDKASRNRIAVRKPQANGMNYVNGMSSFDDDYQDFIDNQRKIYLKESAQDSNSIDACYFRFCDGVLKNMKSYMKKISENLTVDYLIDVMSTSDSDGAMCKAGKKVHPDELHPGYTVIQRLFYLDDKSMWRRQWRGDTPVWDDPWEIVKYISPTP